MIEMMRDFDQNYLSTASDLPMSANIVHSYVKQTVSDFFEHYGYESLQNFWNSQLIHATTLPYKSSLYNDK